MNANILRVSNLTDVDQIKRVCDLNFGQIALVLGGKLVPGENLQSTTPLDVSITAANQVVQVAHNLPFTPSNYWIVYQDANAVIFAANSGRYPWTQNYAYLTASAPVKARVILF